MHTQPLVTVIIPCYNAQQYIKKAVLSVLNQTYTNLEVLIIDDASTDNSLPIIRQITDNRIKLISLTQNTKKIGAVNKAIELAQGQYIAFQDADDWSAPQKIELQIEALAQNKHGVCFTNYQIDKQKDKRNIRLSHTEIADEFINYGQSVGNYKPTMCATMLVQSDILKSIGGYHPYFAGRVAEDVHLVYNLLIQTKASAIDQKLYFIQRTPNSFTQQQFSGKNARYAYSWPLLAKIIEYDQQGIDLLNDPQHIELLRKTELQACEQALVQCMQTKHQTELAYKTSAAYKLGHFLLQPIYWLKNKTRHT